MNRRLLRSSDRVPVSAWLCPALSAQERPAKNVLIIHSGDEFFPSNPVLDAAIRTALISASHSHG